MTGGGGLPVLTDFRNARGGSWSPPMSAARGVDVKGVAMRQLRRRRPWPVRTGWAGRRARSRATPTCPTARRTRSCAAARATTSLSKTREQPARLGAVAARRGPANSRRWSRSARAVPVVRGRRRSPVPECGAGAVSNPCSAPPPATTCSAPSADVRRAACLRLPCRAAAAAAARHADADRAAAVEAARRIAARLAGGGYK